jgi:hypothetical protein
MATQMITKGSVQFNGQTVELGKPVLVNGRLGKPFMAWVRDGVSPDGLKGQPSVTVRVKWDNTYMPSDFNDRFGPKATFASELAAAA